MPNFICQTCGAEFSVPKCRGHVKYCNSKCYVRTGERNPKWRGGLINMPDGYIYQYSPDHPNATKSGYVLQHRLVVEKRIGRFLLPSEAVHHINGIRNDNRDANLICCQSNGSHSQEHHNKTRNKFGQFGEKEHARKGKLSEIVETEIVERHLQGATQREICEKFGIPRTLVVSVLKRKLISCYHTNPSPST